MKAIKMKKISSNKYISDITDFMDDYLLIKFQSPYKTYLQSNCMIGNSVFIKLANEIIGYIEITNNTIKSVTLFLQGDNSLYTTKMSSELLNSKYAGCFVM